MDNFNKVVRIGTIKEGKRNASIYCGIKYTEGHLSISGVIGPLKSGNALGSCGQINMSFWHRNSKKEKGLIKPDAINFAPKWNVEQWLDFLDVWEKYHLNDLRAGCEHQRKEEWGKKELTLVRVENHLWRYSSIINYAEIKFAFKDIEKCYKTGKFNPKLLIKKYSHSACKAYIFAIQDALEGKVFIPCKGSTSSTWVGEDKPIKIVTEKKLSSWVYPSEHSEGVLTKPCSVCGYKYGTAWLKEEVSEETINFLLSLPDTDKEPAWI